MNQIEEQYFSDRLSSADLARLREQTNRQTDEELANQLYSRWMDNNIAGYPDNDVLVAIKQRIDKRTGRQQRHKARIVRRSLIAAAAILLPLILTFTGYLYRQNTALGASRLTFATGRGEQATVILPDGTVVTLSYDSRLVYLPSAFSQGERHINFEGEGWFRVAKDAKRPFRIDNSHVQVEVLGTVFDLSVRNSLSAATLALEQGRVRLTSVRTGKVATLNPGQTAIIDYATGQISVNHNADVASAKSWRTGRLTFSDAPIDKVIASLGNAYGVDISMRSAPRQGHFTGALPIHDFDEALLILCKTYKMRCERKEGKILLVP